MKINIVKVVQITGTVLGVASTLLSGWAGQKSMNSAVAKEVAKALAKQAKES